MTEDTNTPPKGLLWWHELPPDQRDAEIAKARAISEEMEREKAAERDELIATGKLIVMERK